MPWPSSKFPTDCLRVRAERAPPLQPRHFLRRDKWMKTRLSAAAISPQTRRRTASEKHTQHYAKVKLSAQVRGLLLVGPVRRSHEQRAGHRLGLMLSLQLQQNPAVPLRSLQQTLRAAWATASLQLRELLRSPHAAGSCRGAALSPGPHRAPPAGRSPAAIMRPRHVCARHGAGRAQGAGLGQGAGQRGPGDGSRAHWRAGVTRRAAGRERGRAPPRAGGGRPRARGPLVGGSRAAVEALRR